MSLNHLRRNLQSIGFVLGLSFLLMGFAFNAPSIVHGQTGTNQTYDCGTYGAGDYGQNECLTASDVTPTPTATPAQEELDGSLPDSGASLGWWAAIGALLLALGLGFYGYNRRQKRLNGGTN